LNAFVTQELLDCKDGLLLSKDTDEVTSKLCDFLVHQHRRGYNAQSVITQLKPTIRSLVSIQIGRLQEDKVRTPGDWPIFIVALTVCIV
jgi:hypothetical protein